MSTDFFPCKTFLCISFLALLGIQLPVMGQTVQGEPGFLKLLTSEQQQVLTEFHKQVVSDRIAFRGENGPLILPASVLDEAFTLFTTVQFREEEWGVFDKPVAASSTLARLYFGEVIHALDSLLVYPTPAGKPVPLLQVEYPRTSDKPHVIETVDGLKATATEGQIEKLKTILRVSLGMQRRLT